MLCDPNHARKGHAHLQPPSLVVSHLAKHHSYKPRSPCVHLYEKNTVSKIRPAWSVFEYEGSCRRPEDQRTKKSRAIEPVPPCVSQTGLMMCIAPAREQSQLLSYSSGCPDGRYRLSVTYQRYAREGKEGRGRDRVWSWASGIILGHDRAQMRIRVEENASRYR